MESQGLLSLIEPVALTPRVLKKISPGPGCSVVLTSVSLSCTNTSKATHCVILESNWDEAKEEFGNKTVVARLRAGSNECQSLGIELSNHDGPFRLSIAGPCKGDALGRVDVVLTHLVDTGVVGSVVQGSYF